MEAMFVKFSISLLGILLVPFVGIIFISIVCAICLSAAIYINVLLTLTREVGVFGKNRRTTSIPNEIK